MRKIKLTEKDLHNIIAESVNRVISELDWRTYANASDKAMQRNEPKRAKRFNDASADAFNSRFADSSSVIDADDDTNNYDIRMTSTYDKYGKPYRDLNARIDGKDYNLDTIGNVKTPNRAAARSLDRAEDEMLSHYAGKTRYNKSNNLVNKILGRKGWSRTDTPNPQGWRRYHQGE